METQTNTITIELAGCPPSFANLRGHWAKLHREKAHWKQQTHMQAASARHGLGWPPADTEREVAITMYRAGRVLDMDNAFAAVKPLVDGLTQAKLIVDDHPQWLELHVHQVIVAQRGLQRTVIQVQEGSGAVTGIVETKANQALLPDPGKPAPLEPDLPL